VSLAPLFSDAWLTECNGALASMPVPGRDARPLVVTERIVGVPASARDAVTLVSDEAGVRLVAGEQPGATAWLTVSMEDAAALHDGRLEPSTALAEGRIRVRGDLRGVVEAVGLLSAAHASLRGARRNRETGSPDDA
jgi:hypothetical protein